MYRPIDLLVGAVRAHSGELSDDLESARDVEHNDFFGSPPIHGGLRGDP